MGYLDDRMKRYEYVDRFFLTRRLPAIIRIDGKSFHSFTRGMVKPWDSHLKVCMLYAAQRLCEQVMGAKLAYWQSDEISILMVDYDTLETEPWFNKNIQKISSVTASIATASFNQMYRRVFGDPEDYHKLAHFDARVFTIPHDEVCNYFLWRQQDASKNSINMLGQSQFSHNALHGLSQQKVQDKLFKEKQINWNACKTWEKRGACIIKQSEKWTFDEEIPIFSTDRDYINKHVYL